MAKRLSAKQRKQRAKDRRSAVKVLENRAAIQTSGAMRPGKRRRGSSTMSGNRKGNPATSRATRIIREQIELAPDSAILLGDKRGNGKLLTYYREN